MNPDGSLDGSFPWKAGINAGLKCIAVKEDGKIIVAGQLCWENIADVSLIARVNGDGALDTTSKAPIIGNGCSPSNDNYMVNTLALQPDGRIVIGGKFRIRREDGLYDTSYSHLVRLLADGTLDKTSQAKEGPDMPVSSIVIDYNGKIIIGGIFNSHNGIPRHRLAKLHGDGSLDKSFNPGKGPDEGNFIVSIVPLNDVKIVIGGSFVSFNGVARRKVARLNGDGSLDTSFNSGKGADDDVNTVMRQHDGRLLIGGGFLTYNGINRNRIARIWY